MRYGSVRGGDPMLTVGGRYRLETTIGTGGMGQVWRGRDILLDRPVAVKVLRPDSTSATADDLLAEARNAARLVHPNVVHLYDIGLAGRDGAERPYIVMELLDGTTLGERLTEGPLDWRAAARFGAQIAAGLSAAHSRDLVHRDVKP